MPFLQTQLLRGHTVLPRLTAGAVVFDCGANRGEFATIMSQRFGCRVFSFEPNPALFSQLPKRPNVIYLPYAIGGQDGTIPFQVGENCESSSIVATPAGHASTIDVPIRRLDTLLAETGVDRVALLKMDIEGAEIAALAEASDETLKRFDQFTVEFHDLIGYVTPEQVRGTLARLRQLGFVVCVMTKTGSGHGDVMAVQTATTGFTEATGRRVERFDKNARGVGRLTKRLLRRGDGVAFGKTS